MSNKQLKKQVYIIHGYESSPNKNWFPWLKDTLTKDGIEVHALSMPNPDQPTLNEWIAHLEQSVTNADENTYFITHSLGCISFLQYFQQANLTKPIGGFILVSGFYQPLAGYSHLDAFTKPSLDSKKIAALAPKRAVIAAENDSIVPFPYIKKLGEHIQADFYSFETGGHFMDSEGFTTFPFVYEILKKFME